MSHFNRPKSVISGSASASAFSASHSHSQSGVDSPTGSQLSYASSIMNNDTRAIFNERLYQLQSALKKL